METVASDVAVAVASVGAFDDVGRTVTRERERRLCDRCSEGELGRMPHNPWHEQMGART